MEIKQQLTNIGSYKRALHKILYKALDQLDTTEKDLNIDNPVKIILCYDNYINANILPYVFEDPECPVQDDGKFLVSNMIEMEMLLELGSVDLNLFNKVISDVLVRNDRNNRNSVSLFEVMNDNGYSTNSFWVSPIFQEYKDLLNDIKNRHEFFKNT